MAHRVSDLITHLTQQLIPAYEDPVLRTQTARWMLRAVTGQRLAQLIARDDIELTDEQQRTLADWVAQQVEHNQPLQYLIGWVPFGDLKISVRPPVLIPRPETEEWTLQLIDQLRQCTNTQFQILDLCTGTGCIALALADVFPSAEVVGTDISDDALELARHNAQANNISNVSFVNSNVYDQLQPQRRFDVIVANPPYIAPRAWEQLSPFVTQWEDKDALVADDDGLAIIERIVTGADTWLQPNPEIHKKQLPNLVVEIGYDQGPAVYQLFERCNAEHIVVHQDLEGKDRVVSGFIHTK